MFFLFPEVSGKQLRIARFFDYCCVFRRNAGEQLIFVL
jgi:hypothetical protein